MLNMYWGNQKGNISFKSQVLPSLAQGALCQLCCGAYIETQALIFA